MPLYEYPGGILPEERHLIETFEADVLPYVVKHGPELGELAMQGDQDCEEIIRRYRLFVEGMAHLRPWNYRLLVGAMKRWEAKRAN